MLLDFIELEKGTGEAMYLTLSRKIQEAAEKGLIKSGERLPSIREAAAQLRVSRTTVENAYVRLCIEGWAESLPQRGYFLQNIKKAPAPHPEAKTPAQKIRYDFSARSIDMRAADANLWKKTVREVLRNTEELISYGDPQGEQRLRTALADYAYKARGVQCTAEHIVIGAGVGPLLNILCGLIGRQITAGFEGTLFSQADRIFRDYGISTQTLPSDRFGAEITPLRRSGVSLLFLLPSSLPRISATGLSARRNQLAAWVREDPARLIVEDDYNGELRYYARSVTAFQPKAPEQTVYIGSFSKLLLPSVRIAYMILPESLRRLFEERKRWYNSTCGKVEQLALTAYIETGALEKHLRRLRKLYASKSRRFCEEIRLFFPDAGLTLYESSLAVGVTLPLAVKTEELCRAAAARGIRILPGKSDGEMRLCFSGMTENEFAPALSALREAILPFSEC